MKRHFQTLYRSFFDKSLYQSVATERTGFGGVYILFLAFLLSLPVMAVMVQGVHEARTKDIPSVIAQLPVITIKKGVVSVDRPEPIVIHFSEKRSKDDVTMLINTRLSMEEMVKQDAKIGLGKNFLIIKKEHETRTIMLDEVKDFVLTQDVVNKFVRIGLAIVPVVTFPFLVLFQWIGILIEAFIIAVISYIVTALIKRPLDFETRMRVCAVALTPSAIISTVMQYTIHETLGWISIVVTLVYIFCMLRTSKPVQESLPL